LASAVAGNRIRLAEMARIQVCLDQNTIDEEQFLANLDEIRQLLHAKVQFLLVLEFEKIEPAIKRDYENKD
jgi:hypothetical protein